MARADKKQRQRIKRDAKKREHRRRDAVSPLKRLAESPGEPECWASSGFPESGQIEIFAWKQGAGLDGVGCFLVDRGVVGLKDAWVRMHLDRSQLEAMLKTSNEHGVQMVRIPLAAAKRVIAGGVRWAHDNGMRLPTDWVRTASILGGLGDWASADVSDFRKEFAGNPEDLRRRLMTQPFETYVKESGVAFVFTDRAPVMDMETGVYVDTGDDLDDSDDLDDLDFAGDSEDGLNHEKMKWVYQDGSPTAIDLADQTREWITARGETPSPELFDAWRCLIVAMVVATSSVPDGPSAEHVTVFGVAMKAAQGWIEPERRDELDIAIKQTDDHLTADPGLLDRAFAVE